MRVITTCRSCESTNLKQFLDLGEHYLSDFRKDNSKTPKCPLVGIICQDCMLVQLKHTASADDMYHENYGFKSGVSNSIKDDLKDIVSTALEYQENPQNWLDIASNDGTLLSFVPRSIHRTGVDPITKYCKEAESHADRIVNAFFDAKEFGGYGGANGEYDYERFSVITSISCFYDMDDPNKFVHDVTKVLNSDGIWVIQQNYLLPTLKLNAVDNFCAEHLEYYTLLSLEPLLERHGLEVIDLSTSMVNGGSLRTIVAKKGAYPIQTAVEKQRIIESDYGLHTMTPYERFAVDVIDNLMVLKASVDDFNKRGEKVYILAASTRGATIWQAAGITEKDVPFAVERNPEKVGRYFNAVGMPIISEEQARLDKPDYMIIGPWFFAKEILARERQYVLDGGALIIPLPLLTIIEKEDIYEYLGDLDADVQTTPQVTASS